VNRGVVDEVDPACPCGWRSGFGPWYHLRMSLGPIGPNSTAASANRNWVADVYGKPRGSAQGFAVPGAATNGTPSGVLAGVKPGLRKELSAGVVPGAIVAAGSKVDVVDVSPAGKGGPAAAGGSGAPSTGVYSMYRRPEDRMAAAVGVEVGRRIDVKG
jgi:hypothetical protein